MKAHGFWLSVIISAGLLPAPRCRADAPTIDVQLFTNSFTYYQGFALTPTSVTMTITNNGGGDLNWTISTLTPGRKWLQASPSSGTTLGGGLHTNVTLTIDPAGVAIGTFQGSLTIAAAPKLSTKAALTLDVSLPSVLTLLQNGNLGTVYQEDGHFPALVVPLSIRQWNGTALVPVKKDYAIQSNVPWLPVPVPVHTSSATLSFSSNGSVFIIIIPSSQTVRAALFSFLPSAKISPSCRTGTG
jgi:hypothetical protein